MDKLSVNIISPTKVLYKGEADKVRVSSRDFMGEFVILPKHEPLTSVVGNGTVIITNENETKEATLFGGFLVVKDDELTILADVAEWPEEIDIERAQAAKERAQARLKQEDIDFERARIALLRAITRIDIVEKTRK